MCVTIDLIYGTRPNTVAMCIGVGAVLGVFHVLKPIIKKLMKV